ncbi:hypothetical protein N1851_018645 [Merluccius polli]|uniref:THAP-type domain-containing protein n=1 Tax=Merluccius polli TaxID=89951 RepID=A0AA47MMU9_MERPO|nr:hypothetical protein N1851_018645 [Merluccius polli]
MVQCFVPDCCHRSGVHQCRFHRFPSSVAAKRRRADRKPNESSRVCSCHFTEGLERGPIWFPGRGKSLPAEGSPPMEESLPAEGSPPMEESLLVEESVPVDRVRLQTPKCQRFRYSASTLEEKVLRMETGLPDRRIFNIFVGYTRRFTESIVYYAGWKVESLSLDDQVFMTLMKLRHNYTNLHLAQLFQCSSSCVTNVVLTFIHVLHELWFKDIITTVPSREKNLTSLPSSFQMYRNCRMIIDCTDVEIATPSSMDLQKHTYSKYRGMHSFKILLVSDKAIVAKSGILEVFRSGDLILADKGFLIRDILPEGVSVNIPPLLNHGRLTKNGEVAGGLLRDVKLPLYLVPVLMILLQAVDATFPLMKVEGLLLHGFLNCILPPAEWALHLNDVCLSHQIIGGGTQDP